jgi:hypothetical protein
MKNETVGYMPNYTTCNGGENLSTEDRTDIQVEVEKIWGGKDD